MTTLLIALHVGVCLFLIFVVLLQSAQAADLAGAFGGGGSQTALGMRGATTLLQKATTGAAIVFMLTSLALGFVDREQTSLIQGLGDSASSAPASPAAQQSEPAAEDTGAQQAAPAGDQGTQQQQQHQQGEGTTEGQQGSQR